MSLISAQEYFISAMGALKEEDRQYKATVPLALRSGIKRKALKQKVIDGLYAVIHTMLPIRLTDRMKSLISLSLEYSDNGFKAYLLYDPVELRRTQWVEVEVTFESREIKVTKVLNRSLIELYFMFDEKFALREVQIQHKELRGSNDDPFVVRYVHLTPGGIVIPQEENVKVPALFTDGKVEYSDLLKDMVDYSLSEAIVLEGYLVAE